MRPGALLPIILAAGAVVLSFLCLFAGYKKDFMEDYHIMTLNTSRIGQGYINSNSAGQNSSDGGFWSSLFNNITNSISDNVDDAVDEFAEEIGIEDFYSYHILDYCYGSYTPSAVPNATLHSNQIHKNVSGCSNRTAMFHFDPDAILSEQLDEAGVPITLEDLNWPDQIEIALNALTITARATFVLYCIGIGLALISFVTSLMGLLSSSRITAFINIFTALLAFLSLAIASAMITAIMVKASNVINRYRDDSHVEAHRGGKYLALTWAATGCMFVAVLIWSFECCVGSKRRTHRTYTDKPARV